MPLAAVSISFTGVAKSITSNFLSNRGGNCASIKSITTFPPSTLISIGIEGSDNLTMILPSPFSPLLKSIFSILATTEEYDVSSLVVPEYDLFEESPLDATTPLPKFRITVLPLTSTE